MDTIMSSFFPEGSLLILKRRDGTELQGTVSGFSAQGVSLTSPDGQVLLVTPETLSEATYLYTGFPAIEERTEAQMVKANGHIDTYSAGTGFLLDNFERKYQFRKDSIVDERLRALAESDPDSLKGRDIFFVRDSTPDLGLQRFYIMDASSLDGILDQVALLAQKGEFRIARLFCESLQKEYKDDEDIRSFLQKLDSCYLDFYAPLPDFGPGILAPRGRILRSSGNGESLSIIDVSSQKVLFSYGAQRMGDLYELSDEELIGLPVVYTVMKGKSQARTVTRPIPFSEALQMANELWEDYDLPLNAIDMLRLILRQTDDPDVKSLLNKWKAEKGAGLWDVAIPREYDGPPRQRVVQLVGSVNLTRAITHTYQTRNKVLPEVPTIRFGNLDLGEAPFSVPVMETPVPASLLSVPRQEETIPVEALTLETAAPAEAAEVPVIPEIPDISVEDDLFSLDNCPSGDRLLGPNAVATYRYRSGIIRASRDGVEKRYSFALDDFLDDGLREDAENFQYAETYFRKQVLCSFDDVHDQASCICLPGKVADLLGIAKDLLSSAYEMPHQPGDNQALTELKRALGYTQLVLNAIPGHTLASALRSEIHSVIQRLDDVCYKAPVGALRPTGVVYQIMANGMIRLADAAYPKGIMLSPAHIVDKEYRKHRPGDELVYSIYSNNEGKVYPRFAHLARTTGELLRMADEWANEGSIENAWGIVMNILDAERSHEGALARKNEYEQMTSEDGSPAVSLDCRSRRNAIVRTDSFASAERNKQRGRYRDAILNYQAALASARDNEPGKKISCIQNIIDLYSQLLHQNPDDRILRDQYRQFGTDNLLISGKTPLSFHLIGTKLPYLETIIRFYEDMGDALHLAQAYEQKRKLIANPPKDQRLPEDKYRIVAAEVIAHISWNYIRAGFQDDANQALEEALAYDPANQLAIQCRAVLLGRTLSGRDAKSLSDQLQPFSLDNLDISMEALTLGNEHTSSNLILQRFKLLARLQVQENDTAAILASYLTTLLVSPSDYEQAMRKIANLPVDCQVVRQLDQCVRKGIDWSGWNDLRLACVFSSDVARTICQGMFSLDKDFLRAWLLTFPSTPPDGLQHQTWTLALATRNFQRWRKAQYDAYVRAVEPFRTVSNDLEGLMKQFTTIAGYGQQPWMQKDDFEWAFRCRRLSESIDKYSRAVSSRDVHDTYAAIKEDTARVTNRLRKSPTVLSYLTCYPLLKALDTALDKDFAARRFVDPVPEAKLVTASDLRDDRTMLVELVIETQDNADRMDDCVLSVIPTADVQYDGYDSVRTYSDRNRVYGGEPMFYFVRIRLGQYAVSSRLAQLQLSFSFQKADGNREEVLLKLDIPVTDDFQPYTNPYSNLGNKEENPARFYGRDKDIKVVIDALSVPGAFPHFLIYGQKRSGKSSLLFHIRKNLDNRRFLTSEICFLSCKVNREEDIYYHILSTFRKDLQEKNSDLLRIPGFPEEELLPVFRTPYIEETTLETFIDTFRNLKSFMSRSSYWKDCKIVLFIDEFTKAYDWWLEKKISNDFLQHWKSLHGRSLFCAVVVGQDTLPAFIEDSGNKNSFGVFEKSIRVSFLPEEEAKKMVTEPIIEATGDPNVFIGDAVRRILIYSACSALHTKWVCREIINRMNVYELKKITVADVEEAVQEGISFGDKTDVDNLIDPLTSAGLDECFSGRFTAAQAESVLNVVALAESKAPAQGCYRKHIFVPDVDVNALLEDLHRRDVLFVQHDYWFLRVKLYLLWVKRKLHGSE